MIRSLILLFLVGCTAVPNVDWQNDIFKFQKNHDRWLTNSLEVAADTPERSIGAGQRIYTPDDKRALDIIEDDRPYAGYAYAFGELRELETSHTDSIRLELGIVGPSARAEEVQNSVHRILGQQEFLGWANQLRDEPTANVHARRTWHVIRDKPVTVDTYAEAAAGNVFTATLGGVRTQWRYGQGDWWGMLFAGLEAQAKARDMFLDGNSHKSSHSVEKHTGVGLSFAGYCLGYKRFFFGYLFSWVTREFKGQDQGHSWGNVKLGWGTCN